MEKGKNISYLKRPQWIKELVWNKEFEIIIQNIDDLLNDSEKYLTSITLSDLK